MNKIILMIGSIIFVFLFTLILTPDYKKAKKNKLNYFSEEDYNTRCSIISILISVMINCLIWGWFI